MSEEQQGILNWDEDNRVQSLDTIYKGTVAAIQGNINWYERSATGKKRKAQAIRWMSLLMLGLGSVFPVFIDLLRLNIPSSWATLIIAAGTGLIAYDRYMGFSTAWMRYRTTELMMQSRLESFQYDWEMERISWPSGIPTIEETKKAVKRCASLRNEILIAVQDETQMWVEEFQRNLKLLDENYKTLAKSSHSAALNLVIENGEQFEGGWDLFIDGHWEGHFYGVQATAKNLLPGLREVTIIAQNANNEDVCKMPYTIKIEPGEIVKEKIRLPTERQRVIQLKNSEPPNMRPATHVN